MGHMFLNIIEVKVFHVSKPSKMKRNHDSDYFTTTHFRDPFRFISDKVFLNRFLKRKTEFINKIENFSNFIVRYYHGI